MKKLIDFNSVETFETKKLFKKVKGLFYVYNQNVSMAKLIGDVKGNSSDYSNEKVSNRATNDSTYSNTIKREKYIKSITEFENKISRVKEEFTKEESIIYEESIIKENSDKSIYLDMRKDPHVYYNIKKSCYLKIAVCFGLIKLKDIDAKLFKEDRLIEEKKYLSLKGDTHE